MREEEGLAAEDEVMRSKDEEALGENEEIPAE
jgi:hypothetical protein